MCIVSDQFYSSQWYKYRISLFKEHVLKLFSCLAVTCWLRVRIAKILDKGKNKTVTLIALALCTVVDSLFNVLLRLENNKHCIFETSPNLTQ